MCEHVVAGHVGRELQQQAFAEVARTDARRVEPLHESQRFLGLLERRRAVEVANDVVQSRS